VNMETVKPLIDDVSSLLQATLIACVAPDAQLQNFTRRSMEPQGYSGATLQYYDVTFTRPAMPLSRLTLVIKDAPLIERLAAQRFGQFATLAVPFSYTFDTHTEAPAPICYQYLADDVTMPASQRQKLAAQSLAAIHMANCQPDHPVPAIPQADRATLAQCIDVWWRQPWTQALQDETFAAAFGQHTSGLEEAAARFLAFIDDIWQTRDSLTLIHGDFHGDHVLVQDGRAYIIDWGTVWYGSLYLDLPNYFSPDEAMDYQEALTTHGVVIPAATFREAYHEASRYFGFKYFGIGLWAWQAGDSGRHESMRYWLNAAIHGR
jgi:thiamine kinase-like enzyme